VYALTFFFPKNQFTLLFRPLCPVYTTLPVFTGCEHG